MDRKISVRFLKIGMFVSKLDRPWLGTPFPFQGFVVKSNEQVAKVRHFCKTVTIDIARGVGADSYLMEQKVPKKKLFENTMEYPELSTVQEELPAAKEALESANQDVECIMEDITHSKKINMKAIKNVVVPILESIVRNSDAFMWLSQLREKDAFIYSSAVDGCALAIALGRHIGLPKESMETLAIGVLLMDVGKTMVPRDILENSHQLSDEELVELKKHVSYSLELLRDKPGINKDILDIASTHHEHFDGSGYPEGMVGVSIPIYGRMAAIIDCYVGLTSSRDTGTCMSPHLALQNMYNRRNTHFQDELIEQMLQCMGVYPTGTLVEMSSGEVGIVLSQNRKRRLRPTVMMLLDKDKKKYSEYGVVNLIEQLNDNDGLPYSIKSTLDPGAYGIDAKEFYLDV